MVKRRPPVKPTRVEYMQNGRLLVEVRERCRSGDLIVHDCASDNDDSTFLIYKSAVAGWKLVVPSAA